MLRRVCLCVAGWLLLVMPAHAQLIENIWPFNDAANKGCIPFCIGEVSSVGAGVASSFTITLRGAKPNSIVIIGIYGYAAASTSPPVTSVTSANLTFTKLGELVEGNAAGQTISLWKASSVAGLSSPEVITVTWDFSVQFMAAHVFSMTRSDGAVPPLGYYNGTLAVLNFSTTDPIIISTSQRRDIIIWFSMGFDGSCILATDSNQPPTGFSTISNECWTGLLDGAMGYLLVNNTLSSENYMATSPSGHMGQIVAAITVDPPLVGVIPRSPMTHW